jgi:hypothetical protein
MESRLIPLPPAEGTRPQVPWGLVIWFPHGLVVFEGNERDDFLKKNRMKITYRTYKCELQGLLNAFIPCEAQGVAWRSGC